METGSIPRKCFFFFAMVMVMVVISSFIAGIYGIMNDQLSYTISPEYYTKFKFYQFRLVQAWGDYVFEHPRKGAAVVGFKATWWMGCLIGFFLAFIGMFRYKGSKKEIVKILVNAVFIVIVVTFVTGLIGLAYGYYFLADTGVSWRLPAGLLEVKNYIAVGSMHNFSYIGGFAGLLVAIIYIVIKKRKASGKIAMVK